MVWDAIDSFANRRETIEQIAERLDVSVDAVKGWLSGRNKPFVLMRYEMKHGPIKRNPGRPAK